MIFDTIFALAVQFNAGELTASEYLALVDAECKERFPLPSGDAPASTAS